LASKPAWIRLYEELLQAPDPFVQVYAVRTIGYGKVESARSALVRAAVDADDALRWHLMWAIGQVSKRRDNASLIEAAVSDASPRCRRAAVEAIVSDLEGAEKDIGGKEDDLARIFLQSLNDSDETVRFFAARGLGYCFQVDSVRPRLMKALTDDNVYVRRAAARSLILNNEKAGIPVLIESLRFPSIDTFEFYDREIVKELSLFCGIDFPSETRYDYATWEKWWAAKGAAVDLKENLDIMHRIEKAMATPREREGMQIFDQLQADHPGNIVVINRYLRFCYEWITFRLLTQPRRDERMLRRCLHIQKKLVELEPNQAQHWERLAYYYASLGRYQESIDTMKTALKLNPIDAAYKKTLKQYQMLSRR
jgi:tetratricopeptide (TPR) repeat protein